MSYILEPYSSYVTLHLLVIGGGKLFHPSECLSHSEGLLLCDSMYASYELKPILVIWCAVIDS